MLCKSVSGVVFVHQCRGKSNHFQMKSACAQQHPVKSFGSGIKSCPANGDPFDLPRKSVGAGRRS